MARLQPHLPRRVRPPDIRRQRANPHPDGMPGRTTHLKQSPYPTIISIASIAARIGLPGRLSYSVSKAGLEALTRTLAVEWAPDNIRVVAVAPGFTKTQNQIFIDGKEVTHEAFAQAVPMKRMGWPEEQASVVIFLASQKASYINGQTIVVDGGATIDLRV